MFVIFFFSLSFHVFLYKHSLYHNKYPSMIKVNLIAMQFVSHSDVKNEGQSDFVWRASGRLKFSTWMRIMATKSKSDIEMRARDKMTKFRTRNSAVLQIQIRWHTKQMENTTVTNVYITCDVCGQSFNRKKKKEQENIITKYLMRQLSDSLLPKLFRMRCLSRQGEKEREREQAWGSYWPIPKSQMKMSQLCCSPFNCIYWMQKRCHKKSNEQRLTGAETSKRKW